MSTDFRLVADAPGWVLVMDGVAQSWLDPDDPTHLEFGYMLRMADYLDAARPRGERMRVIHVGGAAMTMARYVAARRPTSPQIVLEPNQALTEMVRCELPLPAKSGIKVRAVDGRSGIAAMPNHYAQVVIVDAFADAQVPAELVTVEFAAELARVLRRDGLVLFNLIDIHPLGWTRRVLATLELRFRVGAQRRIGHPERQAPRQPGRRRQPRAAAAGPGGASCRRLGLPVPRPARARAAAVHGTPGALHRPRRRTLTQRRAGATLFRVSGRTRAQVAKAGDRCMTHGLTGGLPALVPR